MAGMPRGRYDANLGDIMQDVRQIDSFLDVVFEFLYRRTDFYHIMKHGDDKMGLPPGIARRHVMQAYMKYEQLTHGAESAATEPADKRQSAPDTAEEIPEAVESVVEVTATEVSDLPGSPQKSESSPDGAVGSPDAIPASPSVESAAESESEACSQRPLVTNPDTGEVIPDGACSGASGGQTTTAKDTPTSTKCGLNPGDTFNGALRDSYAWSQTLKDVDIKVFVPSTVTKAKQLNVVIKNDSIKVAVKGCSSDGQGEQILVEGQLKQTVRGDETIWSLDPGNCVQLSLEKRKESWWKAVLVGEPDIDQKSIDNTQYVQDMDDESQADYQRVMYDMERKRQGLPSTKEEETHNILRKAWNAEGSPFKGSEFDPSKVNISAS